MNAKPRVLTIIVIVNNQVILNKLEKRVVLASILMDTIMRNIYKYIDKKYLFPIF